MISRMRRLLHRNDLQLCPAGERWCDRCHGRGKVDVLTSLTTKKVCPVCIGSGCILRMDERDDRVGVAEVAADPSTDTQRGTRVTAGARLLRAAVDGAAR